MQHIQTKQFLCSFHDKTTVYLWRNVLQTLQGTVQQSLLTSYQQFTLFPLAAKGTATVWFSLKLCFRV